MIKNSIQKVIMVFVLGFTGNVLASTGCECAGNQSYTEWLEKVNLKCRNAHPKNFDAFTKCLEAEEKQRNLQK